MPANMMAEPGNLRDVSAGCLIGARSGAMTATIDAGAVVFAARNLSQRPAAVSRLLARWMTTTAFGASQCVAFGFYKVTGYIASHTGGVQVLAQRRKTTGFLAIPATELDIRISDTGPLAGGTHDSFEAAAPLEMFTSESLTSPVIAGAEPWRFGDQLPLVLEQNEGLVGVNLAAFGASGVGNLFVGANFYRFGA